MPRIGQENPFKGSTDQLRVRSQASTKLHNSRSRVRVQQVREDRKHFLVRPTYPFWGRNDRRDINHILRQIVEADPSDRPDVKPFTLDGRSRCHPAKAHLTRVSRRGSIWKNKAAGARSNSISADDEIVLPFLPAAEGHPSRG